MHGNYGKQRYFEMLEFLWLARESVKAEGGACVEKNWNCVAIDGRMEEGFVVSVYTPVFTASQLSWPSPRVVSMSEQLKERNPPLLCFVR